MNTLPPSSRERVQQALATLYEEAGVPEHSTSSSIVLLGEIIASTSLNCAEVSGLTMRSAMLHLAHQRTLPEQLTIEDEHAPLAGFLFATERYGTIFACQEDLIVRRRFTVAHELGHYFLHVRPSLPRLREQGLTEIYEYLPIQQIKGDEEEDLEETKSAEASSGELRIVGGTGTLPWSADLVEREADVFAAELLMPRMMVRLLYQRYHGMVSGKDLIWRLASEMLVSGEATRHRLQDLGLIVEAE